MTLGYRLGRRSLSRLEGVHPDLVDVVKLAIEYTLIDFTVLEGVRSIERQKELVEMGRSRTMNSRHLTGHAVDIAAWVNGKVRWELWHYSKIASAMKYAAKELDVPIEWGGDWQNFKDYVHWQLPWERYPK